MCSGWCSFADRHLSGRICRPCSMTSAWRAVERWEGTIEHTLMAPVSRPVHLIGVHLRRAARSDSVVADLSHCDAVLRHRRGRRTELGGVCYSLAVPGRRAAIWPVCCHCLPGARSTDVDDDPGVRPLVSGVYTRGRLRVAQWLPRSRPRRTCSMASAGDHRWCSLREGGRRWGHWRYSARADPIGIGAFRYGEWAKKTGRLTRQG